MNTLNDVFAAYIRRNLPLENVSTVRQFRINLARWAGFIGRLPTINDLNNDAVSEVMARMVREGLSARTANKFRDNILALWRFLCREGLLNKWPDVKAFAEPHRIPTAWTKSQLAKLWKACATSSGMIGFVPAADWWLALHSVAWDSGERIGGLLGVTWLDIDLDRRWIVVRAETRKGHREDKLSRLHPTTCKLLEKFPSQSGIVFAWPYHHDYLWNKYTNLLRKAGLPTDREHKFHCLRKSSASYFEAAGGSAQELLGHSDGRITKRHYLDPRILKPRQASDLLFRP